MSYLIAGPSQIDFDVALRKIYTRLGVRTLMLEGGGSINGALLRSGLVDELSVLIAPVVDGRLGTASIFDANPDATTPRRLTLQSVERLEDHLLWLRYGVEGAAA